MSATEVPNLTWPEIKQVLADPTIQVGLFGPPGVGKTFSLFDMAKGDTTLVTKDKRRVDTKGDPTKRYIGKVQFHAEIAPAEVMGMHVPDGPSFRWEAGPGDLAYARGGLLILDEIDQASGPMKTYLYGLLDRGPGGTISYVGRTFVQQPGYQAVATMNDRPDSGVLPDALLDRFDAWILVTQPSPEQLLLLDSDLRAICVDAYAEASDPVRGPDVTFRLLLGLQRLRKRLPLEKAILAACRNNAKLALALIEVFRLTDDEPITPGIEPEPYIHEEFVHGAATT